MPDIYGNIPARTVNPADANSFIITPQPDTDLTQIVIPTNQPEGQHDPALYAYQQGLNKALTPTQGWEKGNIYAQPKYQIPVADTERYLDPNIGYNPEDNSLEQKYASQQGIFKRFINRTGKMGATAALSFADTFISTVDFLRGENPESDPLIAEHNDFINRLDQTITPNYQTQYQKDNPILSYFNPFQFTSWIDNVGKIQQNLGYTIGALAAATVVDVPLGLITEGAGFALLPKQLARVIENFGNFSKIVANGGKEFEAYKAAIAESDDLVKGINTALSKSASIQKWADMTRFGTGVALSAYGESVMEANQNYLDIKNDLRSKYSDAYGNFNGTDEIAHQIEDLAKQSAKRVLHANFAFLAVSNALGYGAILRPASAAMKATEKALAGEASLALKNINTIEAVASKGIGSKILKSFTQPFGLLAGNLREGVEEGYQYVVSDANKNYYERQFSPKANSDAFTLSDSYSKSIGRVFSTTEGQENILLGILGGAIQTAAGRGIARIRGIAPLRGMAFAQNLAKDLNMYTTTGLFSVPRRETVAQVDLVNQMATAAEKGDVFEYKNLQLEALYNFVASGVKSNKFDLRLQQLESLKGFDKQQFETFWNMDFNETNSKNVNEYVDRLIGKANEIKAQVEKVESVFGTNPYNIKKNPNEKLAHDFYKEQLSLSLIKQKDWQRRVGELREESFKTIPAGNFEDVARLSSEVGVNETIDSFTKKIADLKNSEELAKGNEDLQKTFREEREFLEDKVSDLKTHQKTYDPDLYLNTIQSIYNYYGNANSTKGDFSISDIDTLSIYNNLTDVHSLIDNSKAMADSYKKLATRQGWEDFKTGFLSRLNQYEDSIEILPDGSFRVRTDEPATTSTEQTQSYVNTYLGITTQDEGNKKIDEADKEFIAKVVDPNYETSEDPESVGKKIVAGTQAITPEIQQQAKNLLAEDFKEVAPTPPSTTAATSRQDYLKKQMDALGVNPTPTGETGMDAVYADQDAVLAAANPQVTDSTISKLWDKYIIHPIKLLNQLFSRNFKDVQYNENLRKLLFNTPYSQLDDKVLSKLRVEISETPEEFLHGKFQKVEGSKALYRTAFPLNVAAYVGDTPIGLVHPPSSLRFKRGNEYLTLDHIRDAKEYEEVTGNDPRTYDAFRKSIGAYEQAYKALIDKYKGTVAKVSNKELKELFDLNVTFGSRAQSSKENTSTAIKDLKYQGKGSAILSFPMSYDEASGSYTRAVKPNVLNASELTDEEHQAVLAFVDENIDFIHAQDKRYFYLSKMPDGKFYKTSIIVARPAQEEEAGVASAVELIKNAVANPERKTIDKVNETLNNTLYIADRNASNQKGNQIRLVVTNTGDLVIHVYNTGNKQRLAATVKGAAIQNVNDIKDLTKLLDTALENAKRAKHSRIKAEITTASFKKAILDDETVPVAQVKSNLKASVTPEVFMGFNIELMPKANVEVKAAGTPSPTKVESTQPVVAPAPVVMAAPEPIITETITNETNNTSQEESQVQEPQTEQPVQVQHPEQVPPPVVTESAPSVIVIQPTYVEPVEPKPQPVKTNPLDLWRTPVSDPSDFGHLGAIQLAYRNKYYDEAIRTGTMTEEQVKHIFVSAGLGTALADRVVFRATNKGVGYSVTDLSNLYTNTKQNKDTQLFQMVGNYMLANGTLQASIENDMLDPQTAKDIVDAIISEDTTNRDAKEKASALADTKIEEKKAEDTKVAQQKAAVPVRVGSASNKVKPEDVKLVVSKDEQGNRQFKVLYNNSIIGIIANKADVQIFLDTYNNRKVEEPVIVPKPVISQQYTQRIPKTTSYMQEIVDEQGKVVFEGSLEGAEKYKREHNISDENVTYSDIGETHIEKINPPLPPPVIETEPTFKEGDIVSYRGEKAIVGNTDEDGDITITDEEGNFKAFAKPEQLEAYKEPKAPEQEYEQVSENPLIQAHKLTNEQKKIYGDARDAIVNVYERLLNVIPVPVEIGLFDWNERGRIKNGVVQINLRKADVNTAIHELLHPFIVALKVSNFDLYQNLLLDFRNHPSYDLHTAQVDKAYSDLSQTEKEDEALVRYMADEMETVFNENGTINEEKLAEKHKSFISFIYDWFLGVLRKFWGGLNDKIADTITGEERKSNAGRKASQVEQFQNFTYDKATNSLKGFKVGQKDSSLRMTTDLTDSAELKTRGFTDEHIKAMQNLIDNSTEDKVKFNIEDIQPNTEDELVDVNIKEKDTYKASVSEIPANFTIANVMDLITMQTSLQFDLSKESGAINKMEAYQRDINKEFEDFFKRINKKLEVLKDTGDRRIIGGEIVQANAAKIRAMLRNFDGIEAMTNYIHIGLQGLNSASWLIQDISQTLSKAQEGLVEKYDANGKREWVKSDTDPLTDKLINELNSNLMEARTLMSFYEDVGELSSQYEDMFGEDEFKGLDRTLRKASDTRRRIGKIANALTVEWLYPTLEKQQASAPDRLKVSKEQLAKKLRFADQDVSGISYWMQATINSRDPINAIVAVIVKDKLESHNFQEAQTNFNIRTEWDKFRQRTGLANNVEAAEQYYKDNFLRKVKVWEVVGYDKEAGKPIEEYVERSAFHEEHKWDEYNDELRLFKKSLGDPITDEQWQLYNAKVSQWQNQNDPRLNPANTKYKNGKFETLMKDPYYNLLYTTYKNANNKYGERSLLYGIIPQAYKKQSAIKSKIEDVKGLPTYLKDTFKGKPKGEAVEKTAGDLSNYLFDEEEYMREQDANLDGSYYRGVKSPFTGLLKEEDLDYRLNESVLGFEAAANTFSSLREVQSNVENLKMLLENNVKLGVEGRKIARRDRTGNVLFDRFLKNPENDYATRLNKQLTSFINDTFYGEEEFKSNTGGKLNVNLNTLGRRLGFVTALQNMAGNVYAGISNVTIGNIMSLGESMGGRYYNPKNWTKAVGIYSSNIPNYLKDVTSPVKSKVTQIGILYDAIQGEFRDKYGKNITGNILSRYASGDTFFILSHAAEHQIQLTGMLALMDATKVTLKDGTKVSLYDAFEKNDKGFYSMRKDALWTDEDNLKFTRTLHGISKDLNGNYAAFDKSMLQRYWMGKLALQYRKYLYPAWRSRFASERFDYERGDIQEGYYRTFIKKFWNDLKEYKFNIFQSLPATFGKAKNSDQENYAKRKTMFDIAVMVATTMIATSLAAAEAPDDDDDNQAKERLLLAMLRLRSDVSQYSWTLPQEAFRTISNPSASLNLVKNYLDFIGQLTTDPSEVYKQNGSGYDKGDSKLGQRFEKIVPLYRQYLRWQDPTDQVKYYTLINKDVTPDKDKDK